MSLFIKRALYYRLSVQLLQFLLALHLDDLENASRSNWIVSDSEFESNVANLMSFIQSEEFQPVYVRAKVA